jgi:hypothetical protein
MQHIIQKGVKHIILFVYLSINGTERRIKSENLGGQQVQRQKTHLEDNYCIIVLIPCTSKEMNILYRREMMLLFPFHTIVQYISTHCNRIFYQSRFSKVFDKKLCINVYLICI